MGQEIDGRELGRIHLQLVLATRPRPDMNQMIGIQEIQFGEDHGPLKQFKGWVTGGNDFWHLRRSDPCSHCSALRTIPSSWQSKITLGRARRRMDDSGSQSITNGLHGLSFQCWQGKEMILVGGVVPGRRSMGLSYCWALPFTGQRASGQPGRSTGRDFPALVAPASPVSGWCNLPAWVQPPPL